MVGKSKLNIVYTFFYLSTIDTETKNIVFRSLSVCMSGIYSKSTGWIYGEEEFFCESVGQVHNSNCWEQNLIIENVINCTFKLDTGSDVNLIPISLLEKIQSKVSKKNLNNIKLIKSKVTLRAYNQSKIKTYGSVLLETKLKSKVYLLDFIVTNSQYQPTLGKDSCLLLGMVERKFINSIGSNQFHIPQCCKILELKRVERHIISPYYPWYAMS